MISRPHGENFNFARNIGKRNPNIDIRYFRTDNRDWRIIETLPENQFNAYSYTNTYYIEYNQNFNN